MPPADFVQIGRLRNPERDRERNAKEARPRRAADNRRRRGRGRILGIGLDEDAAIFVQRKRFQVFGSNAVYVLDGSRITFSNVTENDPGLAMCVYDARMHVLNMGDTFNLTTPPAEVHAARGCSREAGNEGGRVGPILT